MPPEQGSGAVRTPGHREPSSRRGQGVHERRTSDPIRAVERVAADLRRELDEVDGGTRNPVGAARALQRLAARHTFEYGGQRDAFRWEAEKLLQPYFRDLTPDQAAKAVVWLALDAAWAGGESHA